MTKVKRGEAAVLRRLDLSRGSKLFDRIDPDWEKRISPYDLFEDTYCYQSGSKTGREYHVAVRKEGKSWFGSCTCPHGGKGDHYVMVPCKHVAAALLLQEDFDSGGGSTEPAPEATPEPHPVQSTEKGRKAAVPPDMDKGTAKGGKTTTPPPPEIVQGEGATRRYWVSTLPTVVPCAAAGQAYQGISVQEIIEGMPLGRAMHKLAESVVLCGDFQLGEIKRVAQENGVEHLLGDLTFLAYAVKSMWNGNRREGEALASYFDEPTTEVRMTHGMKARDNIPVEIVGRADVFEYFSEEDGTSRVTILDWKGSRKQYNYVDQMFGYALCAFAQNKSISEVAVILAWVRFGVCDTMVLTRDEVRKWALRFLKYSVIWDGETYKTGEHCGFCDHATTCPGRAEALRSAVVAYSGKQVPAVIDEAGKLLPIDDLVLALQIARIVQNNAGGFVKKLSNEIGRREPQPIPSMPGKVLWFEEKSKTRIVNSLPAWPILQGYLTDKELAGVVSIKLKTMLDLVAKRAPKGEGAQARREIEAALREVDAIPDVGVKKTLAVINEKKEE